jgi:hypothetical protein
MGIIDDYIILKTKYKFKTIFSKRLRYRIKIYSICPNCKAPNTGFAWCNKCDPGKFLKEGKTSGNSEIDNLIYESQLKTKDYSGSYLEWIPYDRFKDLKPIGEGGFANIFSATWLDGQPIPDKTKVRTGPIRVALKKLKNSKYIEDFINEILGYFKILKIHLI